MFRTSFGFEMLHKARRRARLKALRKKKEKKLARYHAHFDKITKRNTAQSPFLRLPAEIRNMVYYHVFHGAIYSNFDFLPTSSRSLDRYTSSRYYNGKTMRILLVCRQIYQETALLPYKLALFDFVGDPGHATQSSASIDEFGPLEWDVDDFMENRTRAQIMALGRVRARSIWPWGNVTQTGLWWAGHLGHGYSPCEPFIYSYGDLDHVSLV